MAKSNLTRPVHHCQCGDHVWVALTQGYITIASPQDADILASRKWTTLVTPNRKTIYAVSARGRLHRIIFATPPHLRVDHKNTNGLDNRRSNLRNATNKQNACNGPAHKDSTSKYRGVSWYKNYQKWRAAIYVNKKQICLGYYEQEHIAAFIYDAAAKVYFGEFASLNFP